MKKDNSRRLFGGLVVIFFTLFLIGNAAAQSKEVKFPTRPLSIIVPYGAGGAPDIHARLVAIYWKKILGQPVVVVNKPGAGGALGYREIAHSQPDGYTLGCMAFPNSPVLAAEKGKDAGFRNEDFIPVANFTRTPDALAIGKDPPFKTFQEFLTYAKKNPKKVSVSFAGRRQLLEAILIEQELGIELNPVVFKSGGELIISLLGGHVQASVVASSLVVSALQKGVVPLALTGSRRMEKLPGVPSFKELGYNVSIELTTPLVVPKGTPEPVLKKITATLMEMRKDKDFIEKVNASGAIYDAMFPPELEKYYEDTCSSISRIVERNKSRFVE